MQNNFAQVLQNRWPEGIVEPSETEKLGPHFPLSKQSLLWAKTQRSRPKRDLSYCLRRKLGVSSEPGCLNLDRSYFEGG